MPMIKLNLLPMMASSAQQNYIPARPIVQYLGQTVCATFLILEAVTYPTVPKTFSEKKSLFGIKI